MKRGRPIMLGVVGDSAAGKSTLTNGLMDLIGRDRVTHVCLDDYHRYDRVERARLGITPLHPECNYIDVMEQHLEQIHYGLPILKPVYDHSTGSLVRPEYVEPREFVLVDGLLAFSTPVLRDFIDVKVFLDPPESLRREWKIKRDTTKRGYTAEQVIEEMDRREPDAQQFIRPQREYADIVVRFHPAARSNGVAATDVLNAQLVLRPTIPHPDLTYLLEETHRADRGVRLVLGRDAGRPVDFLEIDDGIGDAHARELEDAIWRQLPDLTRVGVNELGTYFDRGVERRSRQLAVTQLLLTHHLLRKFADETQLRFAPPVGAIRRLNAIAVTDGALAPV